MDVNTCSEAERYKTSKIEMDRRKRAFITLLSSLYLTVSILSLKAIIALPGILVPALITVAIIFSLLIIRVNMLLDKQSCLKICLSEDELEWKFKDSKDILSLAETKNIRIKRTTKGLLREIRIGTYGMKYLYINGLEEFEKFNEDLIRKTKNVKIKKFKEPIDFDHPLYYVFFGMAVGIGTTLLFRIISVVGPDSLRFIQLLIACFVVFTGMLFIIAKPIRGRYGNSNLIADYACGLVFLAIGILIFI